MHQIIIILGKLSIVRSVHPVANLATLFHNRCMRIINGYTCIAIAIY